MVAGSTPLTLSRSPSTGPGPRRTLETTADAGRPSRWRGPTAGGDGLPAARRGHDVVDARSGPRWPSETSRAGRPDDRDEGDQGEADHQRGRRGGACGRGCGPRSRGPGAPACRRGARSASRRRRRSAGPAGTRSSRRPTNSARVPTPRPSSRASGPGRRPASRGPAARPRGDGDDRRAPGVEAAAPAGRTAPSRTAAMGGTRVARIAGMTPASTVIRVPTSSDTTTVRVAKTVPAWGMSSPTAPNRGGEALGQPVAERRGRPATRATPMTSASAITERITWPPRGAEGAQRGQLAGALGHRDRRGC